MSDMSLSRALLLFYVVAASGFTKNLFSRKLQMFFQENRFAQHLIGFITMLVVIILFGSVKNIDDVMLYGIVGYVWFIFTTKIDVQFNIVIILLLLFGFLYDFSLKEKTNNIVCDPGLTEQQKKTALDDINYYKKYITYAVFVTTLIGTAIYFSNKKIQYGGGFDMMSFIFS